MAFQLQPWVESLTHREIEILGLISDGLSNVEISRKLLLSPETIKWYNKQIFSKLGVNSRTQAVRAATEYGFIHPQRVVPPQVDHRPSSNLPAQLTSFVGRVNEIAEIKTQLRSSRLLVLTGAGGCGKSRLAAQVASQLVGDYREGVWLVDLASVSDPALVVNALVQVLQINTSGAASLNDVLKRFLSSKHLMLLLDNFEHVLEACSLVGELLAAAPHLSVLATSRERLHLYGEQEYPVLPLSIPDLNSVMSTDSLIACEAIDLFVQRARSLQPGFKLDDTQLTAIASICIQLDGLPLAVELAASQVKIFPPAIIARRLREGLDALPSGPNDQPPHHRTLRAALEWSYDLLNDDEKVLFARLAVFRGGGTIDAITHIGGGDLSRDILQILAALVEKNLVYPHQVTDGELRFRMLETIHQFAAERLAASGGGDAIRRLHGDYYAVLAETSREDIYTSRQLFWFKRLRDELSNLRTVLAWTLAGNQPEIGMRLAASLDTYWIYNGLAAEGRQWTDLALKFTSQAPIAVRAGVLRSAGHIAAYYGDLPRCEECLSRAIALYRQIPDHSQQAWCMAHLGGVYTEDPLQALQGISLCNQALEIFRNLDEKPGLVYTFNALGELARAHGDYQAAGEYYESCLTLVRETGERHREALLINNLSFVAYHQGDFRQALEYAQQSLLIAREQQNEFRQSCFIATAAGPIAALGHPRCAARLLGASYARYEALGVKHAAVDQAELDRYAVVIRGQLGEATYQDAWQAGQELTLQAAVDLALADLPPQS